MREVILLARFHITLALLTLRTNALEFLCDRAEALYFAVPSAWRRIERAASRFSAYLAASAHSAARACDDFEDFDYPAVASYSDSLLHRLLRAREWAWTVADRLAVKVYYALPYGRLDEPGFRLQKATYRARKKASDAVQQYELAIMDTYQRENHAEFFGFVFYS